ncbi:LADA_0C09692g1_1 [Lachancea dasiensis]|uniref:LADA_0C09692g1_1 n=1 Tax=Lachancea dasiensis TaxID=1072105 RepID=A0A1G4J195_9SACH|nr:LADA_0C09692g1_1 [Lachancea dasiensis]
MSKRKYGNHSDHTDTDLLLSKTARLSQACDRCRLKKIRCNGAKPSCEACTKVGFQCQHSDKLSRRGTPKNYTESLEREVVRLQQSVLQIQKQQSVDGTMQTHEQELSGLSATVAANLKSKEPPACVPHMHPRDFLLQLPFINDTFHLYDNYVTEEGRFLGHATWNILTHTLSDLPTDAIGEEDAWLTRYLIQNFQLSPDCIPVILLQKHQEDAILCGKEIQKCISHFLETSMALVPILNAASWRSDLTRIPHSRTAHPAVLLAYLFICQWQWSCFSDESLFTAAKVVCLNCTRPLLRLQCLLLGSFYFMGSPARSLLTTCSTAPFGSQLLRHATAEIIDLGLYINSHRLTPTQSHAPISHTERLTTFWCHQFLDSWWTLIQGVPKTNFTNDEFTPPNISALKNPQLKPFELLIDFVVGSLDGCNLLKALSPSSHTHMVLMLETFRKKLVKYNLYHRLTDHDVHSLATFVTNMTQSLATEIQLTLYYLVICLLTSLKESGAPSSKKVKFAVHPTQSSLFNQKTSSLRGKSSTLKKPLKCLKAQQEYAYEIMCLYYLTVVELDNSKNIAPSQLKAAHLIPCDNFGVIEICLETLANWASNHYSKNDPDYPLIYKKCQCIIEAWCSIWYFDEPEDELFIRLQALFNISPIQFPARAGQTFDKLLYVHSMKIQTRRSYPLKQCGEGQNSALVGESLNLFGESMATRLPTTETINALFNPMAMQEEDEGYAEDDDEDEESFLEIPTPKKTQSNQKVTTSSGPLVQQGCSTSLFDQRPQVAIRRFSDGSVPDPSHVGSDHTQEDIELSLQSKVAQKSPNDHYLLVQGFRRPSPAVGTPRSLGDLLTPDLNALPPQKSRGESKVSIN